MLYFYVLPGGHRIASCAAPCWCFDCDSIRDGERLFEPDAMSKALYKLIADGIDVEKLKRDSEFLRRQLDPGREYQQQLGKLRAALKWCRSRAAPPRCLKCGSTNIRDYGWSRSSDTFEHPGCGGVFQSVETWHGIQRKFVELDGEGNRVDKEDHLRN